MGGDVVEAARLHLYLSPFDRTPSPCYNCAVQGMDCLTPSVIGNFQLDQRYCKRSRRVNLHEYQAKRLFAEHGVPIPAGKVASTTG